MNDKETEIRIPTVQSIRLLLEPILERLNRIESKINSQTAKTSIPKYYRNADLKEIFNLSNNTIVKYRETGIIPYTKLGDIYLYEVKAIELILEQNKVNVDPY